MLVSKRCLAAMLCCLVALGSLTGCDKGGDEGNSQTVVKTEFAEMTLEPGEPSKEVKAYFEEFQDALHKYNVDTISEYIVQDTPQKGTYLGYMSDESFKDMFKFYVQNVTLEPLEVLQDGWVAVKVTYYDNRYTDFKRPILEGEGDPRGDFYKSVDEAVTVLREQLIELGVDPDAPITVHQKEMPSLEEIREQAMIDARKQLHLDEEDSRPSGEVGIQDLVDEELDKGSAENLNQEVLEIISNIPKATRHEGWNYLKEKSIQEWVEFLKSHKDEMQKVDSVIYVKLQNNGDRFGMLMSDNDFVTLCGRLPIFVGLDTKYILEDYDLYYKWIQFQKEYNNIVNNSFEQWDALRNMSDEEAAHELEIMFHDDLVQYGYDMLNKNGQNVRNTEKWKDAKDDEARAQLLVDERMEIEANLGEILKVYPVFGKYDVAVDMEAIKENFIPRDLSALIDMSVAQLNVRAYYTLLKDDPSLKAFMEVWKSTLEDELIKQDGNKFYVRFKTPDINAIVAELLSKGNTDPIELRESVTETLKKGKDLPYTYQYLNIDIQKGQGQFGIAFGNNFDMELITVMLNDMVQEKLGLTGIKKVELTGSDTDLRVSYPGIPDSIYGGESSEKE